MGEGYWWVSGSVVSSDGFVSSCPLCFLFFFFRFLGQTVHCDWMSVSVITDADISSEDL